MLWKFLHEKENMKNSAQNDEKRIHNSSSKKKIF